MLSAKSSFVLKAIVATTVITIAGGLLNRALTNMKAAPVQAAARIPSTAVTTVIATRQDFCERLVGYGRARPVTISDVSAGVAGDVVWHSPQLEPGNFVEVGTELVRIDDRDHAPAVSAARARLTQAKFVLQQNEISLGKLSELKQISAQELVTSERSHERREELYRSSAISNEDFDVSLLQHAQRQRALLQLEQQEQMAEPEIERSKAEVIAAEASLAQAQADLDRTIVRAPYSGFIDERMAQLGARVAPGTELFRMVDTSRIEVPIALPASQYSAVHAGTPAFVRLGQAGPVLWEGNVARVSPRIDDQERTFFAYLSIETKVGEPSVPAGAFVVAEIDAATHENVIVVPRTALVGEEMYVAEVVDEETSAATIEARTPTIVRLLTSVALLADGVEAGERIVVTNVEKIGHGSAVVIVDRAK